MPRKGRFGGIILDFDAALRGRRCGVPAWFPPALAVEGLPRLRAQTPGVWSGYDSAHRNRPCPPVGWTPRRM